MKLLKQFGFLFIIFSAFVLASFGDGFIDMFGYVFGGYGSDIILIQVMLWFVLFGFIFWSMFQFVFKDNRGISAILAFIIATVGVRYIPDFWMELIETGFSFFILVILILVGLLIPKFFFKTFGVSSKGTKFFLHVIIYGIIIYGLFWVNDYSFGSSILDSIVDFLWEHDFYSLVGMIVIGIYFLYRLFR